MKKITIIICLILTFLFIYLLQVNFFTWFNLGSIKPNLFIIFVLFIGLFSGKSLGTALGITFGLILDFVAGKSIGIYATTLGMTGFLGGYLDMNFSKDSRMTFITMTALATILFEVVNLALEFFIHSVQLDFLYFIRVLMVESLFNCIITIIVYPIILKFGYKIEENFKENKILTRYF